MAVALTSTDPSVGRAPAVYNVLHDIGPSKVVRLWSGIVRLCLEATDIVCSVWVASVCDEAFNCKSVISV